MKWKRWLRIGLTIVVLLLAVVLIGGHFLLRSPFAARKAESVLRDTLGADARIGHVAVGLFGSTTVSNIELHEPDAKKPWLEIEHVSADVSALDLLRGAIGDKNVKVRGAHARLHFDSGNHLLTALPQPPSDTAHATAPAIQLEDGKLTVDQDGREPLVLAGVTATLRQEGDNWLVEGDVNDPQWGPWKIKGQFEPKKELATLELHGDKVALTRKRLRALPFVLTAIWDQVEAEGPANVVLTVRLGGTKGFSYRVDVEPLQAEVFVHSIGLDAMGTTGTAVAEDGLVTLRNLRGRSAGGHVEGNGDLDFRPTPWKLDIRASARRVELQPFTKQWPLPEQIRKITGRLTGSAKLLLTIGDHLNIDGEGQGQVDDARLFGDIKTDGPVKLRLFYLNGKPQFHSAVSRVMPHWSALTQVALLTGLPEMPEEQPKAETPGDDLARTILSYPGRTVSWLQQGIGYLGHAVTGTSKAIMAVLPDKTPMPGKTPAYFEASFGFKDIDVGQLVERLKVGVPFPVAGRGSLKVQVALPVDTPGDLATYRINGTVDLSRVKIAELELNNVKARVRFDKGVLNLEELRGEVPGGTKPGSFLGSARMEVAPLGNIAANLTLTDIPVTRVMSLLPGKDADSAGTFGATLTWSAPADKVRDLTTWKAQAVARADTLRVLGVALDRASTAAHLDKGEATVTQLKFGVEGLSLDGSGALTVKDDYPFQVKLNLDDADLSAVQRAAPGFKLPLTLEGKLTAAASVKGTLTPVKYAVSGSVDSRKLKAGEVSVDSFRSDFKLDEHQLSLEKLNAQLYQGKVTGSVALPLRAEDAGAVNVKLDGLNVGLLAKDLKELPVKLDGEASGKLEGKVAPATREGEREFTSRLDLDAPKLRVQNVPTERLHGRISYRTGLIRYRLEGSALGGTFDVDGRVPLGGERKPAGKDALPKQAAPPAEKEGPSGTVRVRGARLSELMIALARQNLPPPLRGLIDLSLDYTTDAAGELKGEGKAQLSRLRWDQHDLANRLSANLRLAGPELEVRELSGEMLGGSLRLRASLNLRQPERGRIFVSLDRAEASQVAATFFDDESLVEGPFDLRFRGSLGREWRGAGEAILLRGKVAGVEVSEWHLPYTLSFSPAGFAGELDVRESSAMVALGRASLNGLIAWDGGTRLEVQLRMSEVDLRSLLKPFADLDRQLGMGRAKVRLDIIGRDIRSAQDLTGRLDADFNQAQALQLPVLSQLTPFLRGISSATTFEKGDLRATLSRGVWRVSRLTIDSTLLKLLAEGTVTVKGGLNLEVTARTGQLFVNPALLRLVGLATATSLPLEVITLASEWLSNRVVHARVGGTLRNPSVRYEPVRLLTEETIRFLLRSGLPTNVRDFVP